MRRLITISALLLAACHSSKSNEGGGRNAAGDHGNASGATTTTEVPPLRNSNDVLEYLRLLVTANSPKTDDFQVQSIQDAPYIFPIGTLLLPGRTTGDDRTACAPGFAVGDFEMPNTFPVIAMTGDAAFGLGLTKAVTRLADVGINARQNDIFKLAVKDAKGEFLLDHELSQVLNQPACQDYLKGKTMNFVRGYIIGQRSYELSRALQGNGSVGVSMIGNLKVDASRGNVISLVDDRPIKFLQIVSSVTLPAPPPPPPPPPPPDNGNPSPPPPVHIPAVALKPVVSAPIAPPGPGMVYLQRDVADTSGHDAQVKSLLGHLSLNIVPQVEAIASAKMPGVAQVRYFNKEDEALADRALGTLRTIFPNASKLYVGLKAPPGQLEVWLPRAGG